MGNSLWKPVNWIFFDLDDTIWNFSANSAISLRKLYDISPILRKLFNSVEEFIEIYHHHNAILWDLYSQGKVTTSQLKLERWRRTLATRQFEVLTAVCEELETTYLNILAQQHKMIPGVTEMLHRLSKKYILAILSNGFSNTQYKKLRYSGLGEYITRTIVSEEIGINKPDQKIFEYAISETGAMEPFLMVGDHPVSDVLGAMKAGWYAIWYNPQKKTFPFTKDDIIREGANPNHLVANVSDMVSLELEIKKFFKNFQSNL